MKRTIGRVLAASAGAAALVTMGLSGAYAADTVTDPNFAGTIYLASATDGSVWTQTVNGFEDQIVATVNPGADFANAFPIPAGATQAWVFVSPRGQESSPINWNAKSTLGLTAGGILGPNVSLTNQAMTGSGTPQGINAVKAAGGEYSLGIAFTKDNGVNIVVGDSLYYAHITVTAGTGAWTYTEVTDGSDPDPDPAEGSPATQGLSAEVTTLPIVDGLLSLIAPTAATSTIGNATIVDGKSQSTGTLGTFQVQDGRELTKPGWTLTTTSVGDFVNGATTIGKVNLGLAPKNISGVPATLGVAQVAGAATYPSLFAELAAGTAGTTTLDADLTFVAPAGSPAGTYTSTLTVTLVSK